MNSPESTAGLTVRPPTTKPWSALAAVCVGFFMIMVDSTIVAVATPALMAGLGADVNAAVWVTSAYLLAFAVPLLFTGRLGDQFGPKNLYMVGLAVFTVASVACGLSGSITMLIAARALQGAGAALLTPQTMTVITRVFPADKRGSAMGVWGSVVGVALLVGPIVGGLLTDALGWQFIFFINIPVGIAALAMASRFVPTLPTTPHRFDVVGIALSAVGMFALVFGIQQGQAYHWNSTVWASIGCGIAALALFVWGQWRTTGEPLVPLTLFADRNFSLSTIAVVAAGFAITGMTLPLMLFAQEVEGLTSTRAALLLLPMAVLSAVLAPFAGRLVDHAHPRYIAGFGILCFAAALLWFAAVMRPGLAIWELLLPMALLGVANAFIWAPLSATATHNLPDNQAGAGSGVYNTARQIGGVLGSAGVGAVMQSRLSANLTTGAPHNTPGYATAMGQSLLLPVAVLAIGVLAAAMFARPSRGVAHLADTTAPESVRVR
ncbi:DHA2 family efflux MFS transporter permease subunit [Rhodococcus sp. D2-41]|uniref:DHA2 family efflux MFS transporter permease subunit n=1 Tax=Speluncibacter jeojiensis TaxID=2710754 RepID=UPI00240F4251|nr:DHA2 family efflux MFS transporter permease subunit [Rhodococcus sp. D2-41]MDG3011707.1 DHA2 family efflux MFS transporter permease subunit [Rhodococcus sp. D2-41]